MAAYSTGPGRLPAKVSPLRVLVSVLVAVALVAAATAVRAALHAQLGMLSPFMLYIAAVLVAGLVRGPFCGVLVMLGGGLVGLRLFLSPGGVAASGSGLALMLFWAVSTPVLLTANQLRVQLSTAMDRLSAALKRHDDASR